MAKTVYTEALEYASDNITKTFIILFFFGFAMTWTGSLATEHMSLMVKSLQFIFHLPLFKLFVPANVMMLYSRIIPILGWDPIGEWIKWDTQTLYAFTYTEAPIPGQVEELGYE